MNRLVGWLGMLAVVGAMGPWRGHAAPPTEASLAPIQAMLKLPDAQLDLAKAKLTIDRLIDPQVDVAASLRQLESMSAQIKSTLPAGASSRVKVEALRAFLYEPNAGNSQRPFQYDLEDPLGRRIPNKLLSTYLATHRGNCVSMPLLFIVLGQRLGDRRHRRYSARACLREVPRRNRHLVQSRGDERSWVHQ